MPTNVVFFFGGQSTEHEISCLTAVGVLGALDAGRYTAHGVGITRDGRWVRYTASQILELNGSPANGQPAVDSSFPPAVIYRDGADVWLATRQGDRLVDATLVDVAFPLLHGPFGEDGTIQGEFEMLGLPYVGAGVSASAVGMDKHLSKVAFASAGLRVEPYITLETPGWTIEQALQEVHDSALLYPLYVKPARGGSSVGITRVENPADLAGAIEVARSCDQHVIIEQGAIGGREVECSVLGPAPGTSDIRTTRPGEVIMHTKGGFYDYEAKYLAADEAELVVPADLPDDLLDLVRRISTRAFEAIGGEGLSRVDSFVMPDGSVLVNEINTMPGFTPISMYPTMWQADGMSYQDLITDLIDQALARPVWHR